MILLVNPAMAWCPATQVAGFSCQVSLRGLEEEPPQAVLLPKPAVFNCWASNIDKPQVGERTGVWDAKFCAILRV